MISETAAACQRLLSIWQAGRSQDQVTLQSVLDEVD